MKNDLDLYVYILGAMLNKRDRAEMDRRKERFIDCVNFVFKRNPNHSERLLQSISVKTHFPNYDALNRDL